MPSLVENLQHCIHVKMQVAQSLEFYIYAKSVPLLINIKYWDILDDWPTGALLSLVARD